ncbi:inactive selenide, water dikinase-like protein [Drosophila subobscura]|uniref:inactive selenide, water dikinase-like protein n=1 Tax=Drosophila subobscura TaxID=7241 RepID=UPI00155A3783|nr:inactive selenide, water dikinase-like protein [Drosophila subobscura]
MSNNSSAAASEIECDFDGVLMRPFDPCDHDLDANFRLTRFADLSERTKKMPKDVLSKLMSIELKVKGQKETKPEPEPEPQQPKNALDISARGSVFTKPTTLFGDLQLVQGTDFGYPIIDDPYLMGKIACANVLGDVYAKGVVACDNMLMLLAVSTHMTEKERDTILPIMMRGFKDCAMKAGVNVTGGQSVVNRWCIVGGVATSVCKEIEIIQPNKAVPGDVLLLTKPLGTHVALNLHKWMTADGDKWKFLKHSFSEEEVGKAHSMAVKSMCRLNRITAQLMHKYGAHGAIAIAEHGLLGHAETLAACQQNDVALSICNMPVINRMASVATQCGDSFQLMRGRCPEHSGGLLICMDREASIEFCKEMITMEGPSARSWIIGIVAKGDKTVNFSKQRVIDVNI